MRAAPPIMAGAVLLWTLCALPAAAFTETPTFDMEHPTGDPESAAKLRGTGRVEIPSKLNFGLELLYGAPDETGTVAPFASEPGAEDLSIMGRIRRRF